MTDEHFGLVTREGAPVPLTGVKVLGTIAGRGAKVKLSQVFENREARAIEAVYKFPLPEGGTVCRFRTVVDGRVTEGAVEEKKKAFELYDCHEMRKYRAEDFYDASFVRELDQSGYIESLYK